MRNPDVLVVGEALVDVVHRDGAVAEHVGGSPANVALGLGRRGVAVALHTQLGPDERGGLVRRHLEASGVQILPESFSAAATSTATADIADDGQAAYRFDVRWEPEPIARGIRPRLVHTGSIAAFVEPGATVVRAAMRELGAAELTFDPNIRPALLPEHGTAVRMFEETAALATVMKLSDEDARWLYPDVDEDRLIASLLALGPRLVAVTLGARGAVLATQAHTVRVPGVAVDAVDTIGAGDTFMASLVHSVLDAGSADLDAAALQRIGREAARAAAITVSRAGADLPWQRELTK
ncbi:carbohydrate kinase family protein [Microbacterium sp. JZ31]|uniref:carbohydrate kinase family protein n=1 Tax=Microbacterium sp. JZ31 TaxID=1906274 RepID=UPI001933E295|nr:carbohydrate kinase [Microbacterium sp. JZ31]